MDDMDARILFYPLITERPTAICRTIVDEQDF